MDTAALRGALEWRYPKVAWVEVGWRGTALCVRLVEGTPKGNTVDWHGSRDVVASRDGVIVSVVPVAGTARCKPGDVVRKGQVLIAGEERDGAETVRTVSARGTVMARVWDGATVRVSLREKQTEYTGKKLLRQTVRSPSVRFMGHGGGHVCTGGYSRGGAAAGRSVLSPMGAARGMS